MSGYCRECGNQHCICEHFTEKKGDNMKEKTLNITIKCLFDENNNIDSQSIHMDNFDKLNSLEIIGLIEYFKAGFIVDIEGDHRRVQVTK